ncbi:hypothetical protein, partial [Mesorhizobium sp. M2D.F.Ca.ET.224.01.1.1]
DWLPRQHFALFEAAPSAISQGGRPVLRKASPEKVGLVFRHPQLRVAPCLDLALAFCSCAPFGLHFCVPENVRLALHWSHYIKKDLGDVGKGTAKKKYAMAGGGPDRLAGCMRIR